MTESATIDVLQQAVDLLEEDKVKYMPPGGMIERERGLETLRKIIAKKKGQETSTVRPANYSALKEVFSNAIDVYKAKVVFEWYRDTETKTDVDDLVSGLEVAIHELTTESDVPMMIAAAEQEDLTDPWDRRNLSIMKTDYRRASSVPSKLVGDLSNAIGQCTTQWAKARERNDWESIKGPLKKVLDLTIEKATIQGDATGCDPYDAQMHFWAPGNTQKTVDVSFDEMAAVLPPLVQEIVAKQKTQPQVKEFRINAARVHEMNFELAKVMNFSFERGRMDKSVHAFATGSRYDTRMTTAYYEDKGVLDSLYTTLHEGGHGNYYQNPPEKWENQPVGALMDMTVHEAQAMFFERQVGLDPAFLEYLYGFICKYDPGFSKQGSVEEFIASRRVVTPSLIRIDADEVTYPLHCMFRYEIEKMLFKKEASVDDIPELWNGKVKDYLGIDVPDHKHGEMQDIHWYTGYFGYFSDYAQGALGAAQLFAQSKKEIVGLDGQLRHGDLKAITAWTTDKIHRHGAFYGAPDLMVQATGALPNAKPWLNNVRQRYLG